MAGKINKMLDTLIEQVSQGSQIIKNTTRTKIILKGINIDKYNPQSDDDPIIIGKINEIAKEFGIRI